VSELWSGKTYLYMFVASLSMLVTSLTGAAAASIEPRNSAAATLTSATESVLVPVFLASVVVFVSLVLFAYLWLALKLVTGVSGRGERA